MNLKISLHDPEKILANLRWIQENFPLAEFPENVRNLRTRALRQALEMRQAALFSYGMSTAIQKEVRFALKEEADFDAICSFEHEGKQISVPLQLKELVPEQLNPNSNLQNELDKLQKYRNSRDLVVAYHLNRSCDINIRTLNLPQDVVSEIWIYAANNPEQTEWSLTGNILSTDYRTYVFKHPAAREPERI